MSLFKKNPKNEESNNENVQQVESVDDSVVTSSLEQNQDIAEQKKPKTKKFQTEELEEPKPVEHKRIVLEKPKPVDASKIRPKKFISSSLVLNIKIYNKERMLIELVRNKNSIAFDYYKEIISNYREIADEIDMSLLAEYLEKFTNGKNIFEIIHREVF